MPQFPVPKTETPNGHKLDLWLKKFDEYKDYVNRDTILVGHSRGCLFVYRILDRQIPLRATFLIAPWITRYYSEGWTRMKPNDKDPFDWEKMRYGAKHIEVFQSTNDEIPVDEGKQVAANLGAKFILVEKAGHFNTAYDKRFKTFDTLLENIKQQLE